MTFTMEDNKKEQNTNTETAKRRDWKSKARKVVKTHYVILVMLCLVSVFFGTEFSYVTSHTTDTYNFLTGQDPVGTGIKIRIDDKSLLDIAAEKVGIDLPSYAEKSKARAEQIQMAGSQKLSKVKSRERGIFASAANFFSSGKLVSSVVDAAASVIHSKEIASTLLIIASLIVTMFLWAFLQNVYIAILRRMFLEARTYKIVPFSHILHFRVLRRWTAAVRSMFLVSVYKLLWWMTIVGGCIKRYSYLLAPYIIAENPDIAPKEVIDLSRRMMDGHKLEAFKLDVTFVGWHLLGIATFGIAEGVWVVPYKTATFTEFYADRRAEAKADGLEGTELLNDEYLFRKADEDLLKETYNDIEEEQRYIEEHSVTLTPVQKFFTKNMGLWVGKLSDKKAFDEVDSRRQQIAVERETIRGHLYPQRLNPLWKGADVKVSRSASALRTYTIWTIILVFFIFSLVGWGWEVSIHLVKDGIFVNRGVMHGPWLPVYGSGVAMILLILARWRRNPLKQVLLTILLCGCVEYMTSYYFELTKGMRWWDYTGYFLNLNGRICGEGLMVFAIGGMAAVYLLVPLVDTTLSHFNTKILAVISILLLIAFTGDMVYSHNHPNIGEGITDYDAYQNESYVETVQFADAHTYIQQLE